MFSPKNKNEKNTLPFGSPNQKLVTF
uniref:Uncharacterized protein n=1 Tax=Arundo donax TaxID=35708 RepID=A0A0A8YDL2_ARUDO